MKSIYTPACARWQKITQFEENVLVMMAFLTSRTFCLVLSNLYTRGPCNLKTQNQMCYIERGVVAWSTYDCKILNCFRWFFVALHTRGSGGAIKKSWGNRSKLYYGQHAREIVELCNEKSQKRSYWKAKAVACEDNPLQWCAAPMEDSIILPKKKCTGRSEKRIFAISVSRALIRMPLCHAAPISFQ